MRIGKLCVILVGFITLVRRIAYGRLDMSSPLKGKLSKGSFRWPQTLPNESEPCIRRSGLPTMKA